MAMNTKRLQVFRQSRRQSFSCGILAIFLLRSFEKMVRTDALSNIASMQKILLGPHAKCKKPCNSVGWSWNARTAFYFDSAMPPLSSCAKPEPTIVRFENVLPETLPEIFGHWHLGSLLQ